MSVKNFKFVSPGIFINEIDNSFIPKTPDAIGPIVIGRASKGLAMQPTKIESYSDFVNMYGDTVPGHGGGDIYRDGNYQSPMYGTYAAKAFLASGVAPLTYVRVLGQQITTNDGTNAARAGWKTDNQPTGTVDSSNGGAYGLFLFTSSSVGTGDCMGTGSCAAIWYLQNGTIQLSGTAYGTNTITSSAGAYINSTSGGGYTIKIAGAQQGTEVINFDFNNDSQNFIRNQFNTNPQLKGGQDYYPSASLTDYWLGETFEQDVRNNGLHNSASVGIILGIMSGSGASPANMKGQASREAVAGWFIGQDLGVDTSFQAENKQKLFRLKGRGHGEWLHKNVKVSIERIRQSNSSVSPYGTFSVVLRNLYDTDNNVQVIERFDNLSLDPTSPSFVARKIGDKYTTWDETNRRLRTVGEYSNLSKFVYVDMNPDVEAGATDATLLPFGYFGPPVLSGTTAVTNARTTVENEMITYGWNYAGYFGSHTWRGADELFGGTNQNLTASFKFPTDLLRVSASDGGLTDPTNAYFGYRTARTQTSTTSDNSVADGHRLLYAGFPDDPTTSANAAGHGVLEFGYMFSMDDIRNSGNNYYHQTGSRRASNSVSAGGTYKTLLDADYNRFTAPFWGGFDGFDIVKPDPLANSIMATTSTEENDYVYHTYRRSLDTIADPESINMNLLAVPGLTLAALTGYMVNLCEDRADALALIDLPNVWKPTHEEYVVKTSRRATTPISAANDLKDRRIDSSYGATFYPWVQTRDENTGAMVWIPPTVAMMGVLGSSQARSDVWFAPAGFNRGGLTEGAAGIVITNVTERLTSKERDTLYDARINPIASFPSSGIVVFGQKTLQERPSALDRINVRRLVIYLKKQISILSTQILFEQNVQATWDRFKGLIEPFLANVKTRFGISDYRLILDESTTTPDLIDQNIMYAKIMIKPARAIEYIAIDFVITSTGASFDD